MLLQGVCLFSYIYVNDTGFNEGCLVATIDGYQLHLCVLRTFLHTFFMLSYFFLFFYLFKYQSITERYVFHQVLYRSSLLISNITDLLPTSRDQQRFPHPVCKPFLGNQNLFVSELFFFFLPRIIADVVNTVMTIVGIQLIDRVGRRRLLLIGALGMCACEFIIAIVGVTAGHIDPATGAVNVPAQKVLIAFVCMCVSPPSPPLLVSLFLFFGFSFCLYLLIDISLSSLPLGDLSHGYLPEKSS